ncbi:MAG: PEP-CTERM sorting domain-containing protein [Planctomycetaceae bacterium]|nr:PEP-CTERM sorting domain-containing protein [Planctomycetaceae bacterium]
MSVNSQTIRLGVAVLGLVLVVTLCTAFPAKADIVRSWEADGIKNVLVGEISRVTFQVIGDDGMPTYVITPKANRDEYPGYVTTTVTSTTEASIMFMLDFSAPAGATATGHLFTLEPVKTNLADQFDDDALAALFDNMVVTVGGTPAVFAEPRPDNGALTLWFDASVFDEDGSSVAFIFNNNSMPYGAFVATIQETMAPLPSGDIPEPATLAILGLGLAGLGFVRSRKR